jgi:hypothetical protein
MQSDNPLHSAYSSIASFQVNGLAVVLMLGVLEWLCERMCCSIIRSHMMKLNCPKVLKNLVQSPFEISQCSFSCPQVLSDGLLLSLLR